jgi:hypothetical protein
MREKDRISTSITSGSAVSPAILCIAARASSVLPFVASHRGDFGNLNVEARIKKQNRSGIAIGSRQLTEDFCTNDKPKFTQLAAAIPLAMKTPRITTFLPRLRGFVYSDCQTGMMVLATLAPRPDMMRPTTSWARLYALVWITMPSIVTMVKARSVTRRPKRLPIYVLPRAPNKHPRVKIATTVPGVPVSQDVDTRMMSGWDISDSSIFGFLGAGGFVVSMRGKVLVNDLKARTPPRLDWLYPNSRNAGKTTRMIRAVLRRWPWSVRLGAMPLGRWKFL